MTACQHCGAELETPLGCAACGALADLQAGVSPFDILGLTPAFIVDGPDLKKRLKRFSRMTHPDFFTVQGDEALEEVGQLLRHVQGAPVPGVRRRARLLDLFCTHRVSSASRFSGDRSSAKS